MLNINLRNITTEQEAQIKPVSYLSVNAPASEDITYASYAKKLGREPTKDEWNSHFEANVRRMRVGEISTFAASVLQPKIESSKNNTSQDTLLIARSLQLNPRPLVINLIPPGENRLKNNFRSAQIQKFADGNGNILELHISFDWKKELHSSYMTIDGRGNSPKDIVHSNFKGISSSNFISILKKSAENSNRAESTARHTIYINSHTMQGQIYGVVNEFTRFGYSLPEFSKLLAESGVAGKDSTIIFTGCMKPEYLQTFLPELQKFCKRNGISVHFPKQPQNVGKLHNMAYVDKNGTYHSNSPFNGK